MRKWISRVDLAHSEKTTLAHRGLLSTASVGVQGVVRFAYSILIGRLLTPAALAITNSSISLALFVSLLWPTATSSAATKFIARSQGADDHARASRIATHLGRSTLISALAIAVPAGLFSYFFQARQDWLTSMLVMLLVVAWSGYTFVRGVYFAVGQIARALVWDVISSVTSLGLLVTVLLVGWNGLLLLPLALGYLVYAVAGWPRRTEGPDLPASFKAEMNSFIRWTVVGTLASTGFLQLTMVIAHAVGTGQTAGMYAAALTLATPASMLARSFSLLLFPAMARATGRNDLAGVQRQTDLATRGLVVAMGALFAALILLSKPLIDVAYGDRYADASAILPILLTASLLVTLNVGAVNSLSSTTSSGVRIPARLSVVGLAAGLGGMALLIPALGVAGVAWSYLGGTIIIGFGPIAYIWWRDRMPWTGLWLRFAFGAALVVILLFVKEQLRWGYLGDAAALAVFLCAWLLLMRPHLSLLLSRRTAAVE